jgi:DNA polymerase-3 subunit gamma/tau
MWQMLLKALEEVQAAPNAMMAAEMAIIRLTHVADLPSPEELVRKLQDMPAPASPPPGGGVSPSSGTSGSPNAQARSALMPTGGNGPVAMLRPQETPGLERYATFDHVVELIRRNRNAKLLIDVEAGVRLVSYQPGRIEFVPSEKAAPDLAQTLGARLQEWTGNRWAVIIVNEGGANTIAEKRDAAENDLRKQASEHPLVEAVFSAFPKAQILKIRTLQEIATEAEAEALPEVPDEWDPFEED